MHSSQLPTTKTSTVRVGGYESDCNTSGYLSTSTMDSTGEERRLTVNEDNIMSVWNCWSQHIDSFSGPKCSTPKRMYSSGVLKIRISFQTGSGRLEKKSRSEGDVRTPKKPLDNNHAVSQDSGLNTLSSIKYQAFVRQDWKRRPYMTQSTSGNDLQVVGNQRLPRYRVTMNDVTNVRHRPISGYSLDDSMRDLLSNVHQENLVSYLQIFFDSVTGKANIERNGSYGSFYV
ncbi:hypothetical protein DPMN_085221 [Dreissena polymorpha]|uniref:Uncharacterized protein n=1 Tax=Dreissena polymorpha TaxID=45954 RepID=A0A9D3YG10_DREPO|nr:hypothetical protein DPMN_085221 [Dreissena polymorpha]